jgi:hypothetical protein
MPKGSINILGDSNKNFRPAKYERVYEGCKLTFEYKLIKLIDYKEKDLIESKNVFAMITLTHIKAIEAGNNTELKKVFKLSLVKMLREKGFSQEDIKNLHKFVDWLIRFPNDMEEYILNKTIETRVKLIIIYKCYF